MENFAQYRANCFFSCNLEVLEIAFFSFQATAYPMPTLNNNVSTNAIKQQNIFSNFTWKLTSTAYNQCLNTTVGSE